MKKTKTEKAYSSLKNLFQEGAIEKNRVIPVSEIAEMLSMGRAPVLDALKLLESEGYIRIMPQKGIMVKELTLQEMKEINEVRYALETYILSRVAPGIVKEDLEHMRECIEQQKAALDQNDPARFIRADEAFHLCIYEKMQNALMTEVLQKLRDRFFVVGKHLILYPGRMETTIAEHENIADALANGDFKGALEFMVIHLENGRKLIF